MLNKKCAIIEERYYKRSREFYFIVEKIIYLWRNYQFMQKNHSQKSTINLHPNIKTKEYAEN